VAVNPLPKDYPDVPRVKDANDYLFEMLGTSHFPDCPSFFEFLEQYRGISRGSFSDDQLKLLALNTEMMMYNLFVRTVQQQKEHDKSEAQHQADLRKMSLEDLKARAGMLQAQSEYLDKEISRAAQQIAEQDGLEVASLDVDISRSAQILKDKEGKNIDPFPAEGV
jgi:hypothetical protein